ncbi:MAG: hypothetical protein HC874_04095 [Richelia sp. SL_2_1]|nr:hypothetical protein [Richelia sp. SL_2_1]
MRSEELGVRSEELGVGGWWLVVRWWLLVVGGWLRSWWLLVVSGCWLVDGCFSNNHCPRSTVPGQLSPISPTAVQQNVLACRV